MNDSPSTPVIPDHHLIRRIGEGAYGEIWLARNVIGTYRAVKIIYRRTFKDDRPYEREFSGIKKFEPISRTHPGLMDILQVGRNDAEGYFYYVMEVADDFASGQQFHPDTYAPSTLSKQLATRGGALSFDECLQLGLSLADGLAHLHQHNLIHRDIKPSNIIFVNGRAKLADIGLVADISAARTYVGTEGFIPPEGPGTVQADIYSLGKVLYEASTGKDRHLFPELPTLLGELPDRDQFVELNEITVKACAPLPKDRHTSASDLHGELQMLGAGKSVKRMRLLERQLSRATRLAAVSAAVAFVAGGVIYLVNRALEREQQLLAGSYVTAGTRLMDEGNFHAALPFFIAALRLQSGDAKAAEGHRIRIDSVLRHAPALLQSWNETGAVKDLQFSADSQRLLIASGSRAVLRETASGKVLPLNCAMSNDVETVAFSPDEKTILVTADTNVWIGNGISGMTPLSVPGSGKVYSARFSPDGSRIVLARDDLCAYIVDAQTGRKIATLEGHSKAVMSAEFSPNGQRIVTGSKDKTARLWNAETGEPMGQPMSHQNWLYDAAFSPDGKRIVTAGFDAVHVWETDTGNHLLGPMKLKKGARHARFSPDQRFIVSAGWDDRVCVWNATNGQRALPLLNHDRPVMHAVFAPEGRRLATADDAGGVKIWDLEIERPKDLGKAVMSEDGSRYVTYTNNSLRLWDARRDRPLGQTVELTNRIDAVRGNRDGTCVAVMSQLAANTNAINVSVFETRNGAMLSTFGVTQATTVALSGDGKRFAAAVGRNLFIWNIGIGGPAAPPQTLTNPHTPKHIAFSPDGTRIAAAARNQPEVYVWNVPAGQMLLPPLKHDRFVQGIRFTRDGSRLLTACRDGETHPCSAQILDLKTGWIVGGPFRHGDGIQSMTFNADETILATGGEDDVAAVWQVSDGRMLAGELEHSGIVGSVRFSSHGAWLITSAGEFCRVWETASGQAMTPFLVHRHSISDAGFFPENDRIWVQLYDGTLVVWTLGRTQDSIEQLIATADSLGVSNFPLRPQNFPERAFDSERVLSTLRTKSEARLALLLSDLPAWHERQVAECERENNWFGAYFHLNELRKYRPADAELRARGEAAERRYREANVEKQ